MKCGETFIGRWSGNTYTCTQYAQHLHHRGYDSEGDVMEWPNTAGYCATSYPGTADICQRPPNHRGLCRVKIHGKQVTFKVKQ
jgi:hypothetical protein